ncbi:MAG: nucleotidyltransferase domain-containing protein [Flammeovirgaceae bacterium]
MVTQQAAINIAQAFVKECKAIGLTFDKVMLFGSFAKGVAHEGSDIDLLLVSKKFTDDVFANLKHYNKVNIKYPSIETHPYSYQQFMEGDEFIVHIAKVGIEI